MDDLAFALHLAHDAEKLRSQLGLALSISKIGSDDRIHKPGLVFQGDEHHAMALSDCRL